MRWQELSGLHEVGGTVRTFLIGHRGVGKTTVLRALRVRGHFAVDLDEALEERWGPGLFERVGEPEFRRRESEELTRVIEGGASWVALGAGFEDWGHPALVQPRRVVWLTRASDRTGRVFLDRPRLEPELSPLGEFALRRDRREANFERVADEVIELPAFSLEGVAIPERLLGPKPQWEPHLAFGRRGVRVGPPEWALEDGVPQGEFKVLSLHRWGPETLERAGRDFPHAILKYAPPVGTWAELAAGHAWAAIDPARRAFLPCSPESSGGRWSWYRLWQAPKAPITFLREGRGTAPDQPSVDAWLLRRGLDASVFAAVLGEGVALSASPEFHRAFFALRGIPYFAIEVRRGEWDEALEHLTRWGLRFASVTSPHKLAAAQMTGESGPINTLAWRHGRWVGAETDTAGWQVFESLPLPEPRVLWGGGSIARPKGLERVSARNGGGDARRPKTVVWGVPRAVASQVKSPPGAWRPEVIFDLNYAEDSPGREYAQQQAVRYISGAEFFKAQAYKQQEFWKEFL